MKILLTGANGYIGKRLLQELYQQGHSIVCCVRNKSRIDVRDFDNERVQVIELDFENDQTDKIQIDNVDVAYYLIHSMVSSIGKFTEAESRSAMNFVRHLNGTGIKQIIYLSGISNSEDLSEHLSSRKNVEEILKRSNIPVTILRAGIIIGSGSASFEIIRDLVEKIPLMITPKWLNTKSQPIAVRNIIQFLTGVLLNKSTFHNTYDVGGPEVLSYKQMLLKFAEVRNLKRYIFILPIMTPRLSSFWLYFVTSTSYRLAVNLVNSMKIEVVAKENNLKELVSIDLIDFKTAVRESFTSIEQNMVVSSWKDAYASSNESIDVLNFIQAPQNGCFIDKKEIVITNGAGRIIENIWNIGGEEGWYGANYLLIIRSFFDKLFGGVGLRRGRTNQDNLNAGDALDFWRVLIADKQSGRLLLFAEMKLPGEAWLEFKIEKESSVNKLVQTNTFRPKGLTGRFYWYMMWPIHFFIFKGMIKGISEKK
jgi:uncharacterized protein YbjT (DUF2867 family)